MNKCLNHRGVEPHWLSDGGGEGGVYTAHDYTSKKNQKKIKILEEFGYVIYFTYLCPQYKGRPPISRYIGSANMGK